MKKVFLLSLLVAFGISANAQKFTATWHNNTLSNGDTINLTSRQAFDEFEEGMEGVFNVAINNLTSSDVTAKITMVDPTATGVNFGICAGECVPGMNSLPFDVPANGTYPSFPIHIYYCDMATGAPLTRDAIYVMKVYDVNAEGDTLCVLVHFKDPTNSIDEISSNNAVAYPNPSNGNVTISYQMQSQEGILVVNDLMGRNVTRINLSETQGNASINGLSKGIYTYSIISNGHASAAQKLIVR